MDFYFPNCWLTPSPTPTEARAIAAPLTVRSADPKDIKHLVDLLTFSFHPPQDSSFWLYPLLRLGIYEDLRTRLRSPAPHYRCLVASVPASSESDRAETLVGTAEVTLRSSLIGMPRLPYISNFAVSPNYRRQGIGRQLLNRCEQVAQAWNCQDLALHVLEDNQPARQLYFNSGFQLHRIEPSWRHWLFNRPRRLYLQKKLSNAD